MSKIYIDLDDLYFYNSKTRKRLTNLLDRLGYNYRIINLAAEEPYYKLPSHGMIEIV